MNAPMILMSLIIGFFFGSEQNDGRISILVFIITIFFVQTHFRDNFYAVL
jgi:hypothetical protein